MASFGVTPEVSLVLPAYNEASRQQVPAGFGLATTIDRYHEALSREFGPAYQLLVVDDGSTDGTRDLALAHGAEVYTHSPNNGKGFVLRKGMTEHATGLVRVFADADGSYPNDAILGLYEAVHNGAEVAAVYRANTSPGHESLLRDLGHKVIKAWADRIAPTGVRDPQAGAKAFSAGAAETLWGAATLDGWAADTQVLHLAHRLDMSVVEVPAEVTPIGDSRIRPFKDGAQMIKDSWQIRAKANAAVPQHVRLKQPA